MLPVRGATAQCRAASSAIRISIHAPRAGSDGRGTTTCIKEGISIHATRAGSDSGANSARPWTQLFQSMLPVRGATRDGVNAVLSFLFQSMLPVRGATACLWCHPLCMPYFNPCSPCGERQGKYKAVSAAIKFQSMLPVRGATDTPMRSTAKTVISIHAPRAGSDYLRGL